MQTVTGLMIRIRKTKELGVEVIRASYYKLWRNITRPDVWQYYGENVYITYRILELQ